MRDAAGEIDELELGVEAHQEVHVLHVIADEFPEILIVKLVQGPFVFDLPLAQLDSGDVVEGHRVLLLVGILGVERHVVEMHPPREIVRLEIVVVIVPRGLLARLLAPEAHALLRALAEDPAYAVHKIGNVVGFGVPSAEDVGVLDEVEERLQHLRLGLHQGGFGNLADDLPGLLLAHPVRLQREAYGLAEPLQVDADRGQAVERILGRGESAFLVEIGLDVEERQIHLRRVRVHVVVAEASEDHVAVALEQGLAGGDQALAPLLERPEFRRLEFGHAVAEYAPLLAARILVVEEVARRMLAEHALAVHALDHVDQAVVRVMVCVYVHPLLISASASGCTAR